MTPPRRKALITWVPTGKGGRTAPPAGPKYRAVGRFVNDRTWPAQEWTLGIERVESLMNGKAWLARVSWLADAAPHEVLKTGERFEVYEGRRIVANGLIVSSRQPRPTAALVREQLLV